MGGKWLLDIETGYPIVVLENELMAFLQESDDALLEFSLGEEFVNTFISNIILKL